MVHRIIDRKILKKSKFRMKEGSVINVKYTELEISAQFKDNKQY